MMYNNGIMKKLAVLFQEEETRGMDLSHPEKGNPGVGGTAFCFLLFLKFIYGAKGSEDYDITVYQFQDNILPHDKDKCVLVSSLNEALDDASSKGIDIVLLRNHQTDEAYSIFQNYNFKYIFWMHNRLTYTEIKLFRKWKNCKRVIAVGREMYDLYVDDMVSSKLDYILNPLVPPDEQFVRGGDARPWVTYVGSLIPDKNFHMLTAVWKDIIKEVPEAELHVIGSGRLYDKNGKMGSFGHAQQSYEDMFMPHILDDDGKPLESVVFHGIMGDEKYEIFKDTSVGVINPMATETFGLAAIEMEACGAPIVCRRKNGLLDSVEDGKTGLLYADIASLGPNIIKLLKDKELNGKMSKAALSFARTTFRPEGLMPEWVRVLDEVAADKKAKYRKPTANFDNNGKKVRMMLHVVHACPLFRWVPSIHDLQKK